MRRINIDRKDYVTKDSVKTEWKLNVVGFDIVITRTETDNEIRIEGIVDGEKLINEYERRYVSNEKCLIEKSPNYCVAYTMVKFLDSSMEKKK